MTLETDVSSVASGMCRRHIAQQVMHMAPGD